MLAQQLANGVLLGATYALFATGFTLTFGVLRVVNLAYGVLVTLGAFVALALLRASVPLWVALPVAALAAALAGMALDAVLLARLRRARAPELASLMVTLGAALALQGAAAAWLGTDIRRLPPGTLGPALRIAGLRLGQAQLMQLAVASVAVLGLALLLRRTRAGLAIRAIAQEPDAASLVGIPVGRLALAVAALSGALAGTAGVLIGAASNAIHPYMGELLMLRGFAVVIAGGMGSVVGAVAAGLGLGVIETLTASYVDSGLKEVAAFAILVVVLWTRPAGLFGAAALRRA